MGKYLKGKIVAKGKTKILHEIEEQEHLGMIIVESKDDITKNDDKSLTQIMDNKAKYSTATTCTIFTLLKKAGIPVAFEEQISETEFLAPKCTMIPLEVVARRYAVGSYLNRHPNLKKKAGEIIPHRFHRLTFELFLKTTGGMIVMKNGEDWGSTSNNPEKEKPIDDPFISNPYDNVWILKNPKLPSWDKNSDLNRHLRVADFLPNETIIKKIEEITRKVFLIIEGAWAQLGCRLIDFKIEFGIDANGNLLVADVIDNDSWRLRTNDWQELSKQLFRDNAQMGDIADKYALVANLVNRFTIPKQVVVFWRGSDGDKLPDFDNKSSRVAVCLIIQSGHKSPDACLVQLENILANYPEGGVIIAIVGMSNGLGPILVARTSWPVISVCATAEAQPEDVWSSLRMPSQVPMLTLLSSKNAVLAALNILAQKNPAAYMFRQYAIEELDK